MTIKYPNGKQFTSALEKKKSTINHGSRGMSLENEISQSNQYYLSRGIAVVHKKPTPIQIVNVDYPKRSAAIIKEAYFKKASTTDYNGIYLGRYIDFDAKETKQLNSFPLNNFHQHQIKHMQQCYDLGGICFTIIKFTKTDEVYVLNFPDLFKYWKRKEENGKKSISKSEIEHNGYKIKYNLNPLIPYLEAVKTIIDHTNI